MNPRALLRVLPGAAAIALALPAAAGAAEVSLRPSAQEARTFDTSAGGWQASTSTTGLCLPIVCPDVTNRYDAAGKHLTTDVATLAGVISGANVTWRSPSFSVPSDTDVATFSASIRARTAALLTVNGDDARLDTVLVDETVPADSVTIASGVALTPTGGWAAQHATIPAGSLDPAHQYHVELRVRIRTGVLTLGGAGGIDFDDVQLRLVDLEPPTGLSAAVDTAGATRVTGQVDPNGQPTNVVVQYGATTAYGNTAGPAVVSGTGAQGYEIPLAGLTPGQTYHYRVVAESADGSLATADATFTAPVAPIDAAPLVTGALNSRDRTVVYDVPAGVTGARIELLDGDDVIDTITDGDLDGTAPLQLPATDGEYGVRVVRTGAGGLTSTSAAVPVLLDRLAPSVSGVGLAVAPAVSPERQRSVTFTVPADAVSSRVQVIDADGSAVGAPVTALGGTAQVQLGEQDGAYRVRLTVADAAGNTASVLGAAVQLDTSAPSAGGAPVVTGPGNSRDRTVSFDRDPAADATVEILDAEGDVIATVPATSDEADVQLPDEDGTYWVRVRQVDGAGNEAVTASTAVTLDRVPPAAGAAPTVTGADTARARSVSFQRDASAATAVVEVLDDTGAVVTTAPASGSSATITLPDDDGAYDVRVRQTDAAGNAAVSPEAGITLDRMAPAAGPAPVLTGTADALTATFVRAPDTATATIEILDAAGTVVATVPVPTGDSATFALPQGIGDYTIRVVQADAAGNASTTPPASAERTSDGDGDGDGDGGPTTGTGGDDDTTGTGGDNGQLPTGGGSGALRITDPAGYGALLGSCYGSADLALGDVRTVGRRVRLTGLTTLAPGSAITIVDQKGRTVAATTAGAKGTFRATVKRPAKKKRAGMRYRAVAGRLSSKALKLVRRNVLDGIRVRGRTITIRGHVTGLRRGKAFRVAVRGGRGPAACRGGGKTLKATGKVKVNRRTGAYRVKVRVPKGSGRVAVRTVVKRPVRSFSQFVLR